MKQEQINYAKMKEMETKPNCKFCKDGIFAEVDKEWPQYFKDKEKIFCGYLNETVVCFCLIEEDADCILQMPGVIK